MRIEWTSVESFFKKEDSALLDIIFYGMNERSWRSFFRWLEQHDDALIVTNDKEESGVSLDIEMFLKRKENYIVKYSVHHNVTVDLYLSCEQLLECNVSSDLVQSNNQFQALMWLVNQIDRVTSSTRFIISPEFHPEYAFIDSRTIERV